MCELTALHRYCGHASIVVLYGVLEYVHYASALQGYGILYQVQVLQYNFCVGIQVLVVPTKVVLQYCIPRVQYNLRRR
jgi:hypothetical protein